jgi:hypothetical protein
VKSASFLGNRPRRQKWQLNIGNTVFSLCFSFPDGLVFTHPLQAPRRFLDFLPRKWPEANQSISFPMRCFQALAKAFRLIYHRSDATVSPDNH